MTQQIAHIALVVKDDDEAINCYRDKLNFTLVEDTELSADKRWVMMAPPGAKETCILLAKAANDEQLAAVGNQTGGRVFLFLFTDDFHRDYVSMLANGVHFVRTPEEQPHGKVAVFEDLYGNLWDFIQPNGSNKGVL
jgi:catechol 2,3-dioxygenase-like lactoylglutathione lyase family enzyme